MNNTPENPKSSFRAPSPRVTAALAAAMLAVGVAVGAAIGPAPSASLAVGPLVPLIPTLVGAGAKSSTAAQPPAVTPQATPSPAAEASSGASASSTKGAETSSASSTQAETTPTSTTPTSTGKAETTPLPPATKVWLIELANSSFGEAASHASAAPYIEGQAVTSGTLLSGWSALDGSAAASEAALLTEPSPQLLNTIVQPPCPEGAAGAQCAPDTPGALAAADEFLEATLPTITSSAAYRENGLIVVTFASIASASATGLPTGAATATLTAVPPAGVLLISPFVAAHGKSSVAFNPTSPKQSLEELLRR